MRKGSFTLPGESGYEELTLQLADKWGADVIRDSDGTSLSPEILAAGYDIYSTICIIRGHNGWAKKHPNDVQQTFLMSQPVIAQDGVTSIHLLQGYCTEQFVVNDNADSVAFWQVFDRTSGTEVATSNWVLEKEAGNVVIQHTVPFHEYTVNFLAFRIWEEINMYNHVTNGWTSEHLIPIDLRSKEAQDYLSGWLENWCREHPSTNVVRFTSLFYNFVWIWGDNNRRRSCYTDWGSYDFTVSPKALRDFEEVYGYALTSEDFINRGQLHATHMPPTAKLLDYMAFTNRFVVDYGRQLVSLVHGYGKKAYVFYDDSWIGVEPYSELFPQFGFDGIIKCVFSGYEVRLCAGVRAKTHEIRLHPYLFPTGLGGLPTFAPGGDPTRDAATYWTNIRRALLRQCVERIGLGGYLHLVQDYQDFCDYIEKISDEFRTIKELQEHGGAETLPITVAVLHSWGKLRSWTLSGHFHETYMHNLIHVNEALAGFPVHVRFISFEDVKRGALEGVDVVINCGRAGDAWSGGDLWADTEVVEMLSQWTARGGAFIGINEPSALPGRMHYFQMAQILGIDEDTGERVCHGRWAFDTDQVEGLIPEGAKLRPAKGRYLTDSATCVLAAEGEEPILAVHDFGEGRGIYLSEFQKSNANNRLLLNLILYGTGKALTQNFLTDNADCECAWFPKDQTLVVINNTEQPQETGIRVPAAFGGMISVRLEPNETRFLSLQTREGEVNDDHQRI